MGAVMSWWDGPLSRGVLGAAALGDGTRSRPNLCSRGSGAFDPPLGAGSRSAIELVAVWSSSF
jgi:hypothetical protein